MSGSSVGGLSIVAGASAGGCVHDWSGEKFAAVSPSVLAKLRFDNVGVGVAVFCGVGNGGVVRLLLNQFHHRLFLLLEL